MAEFKFNKVIDSIISREGSEYTNHPNDAGGPTKFGITLKTYMAWSGNEKATAKDIESLNEDTAREIYFSLYILSPGYHGIADAQLAELVIDTGVNMGTRKATKMLQEACGAEADGFLGPRTLAKALNKTKRTYYNLFRLRMVEYGRIISKRPENAVFAHGWLKRLNEFEYKD